MPLTRRAVLIAAPALLSGCVTRPAVEETMPSPMVDATHRAMYAALEGEPFPVPAVDLTELDPRFLRQIVVYPTEHLPGTVVVDPVQRYAYLVGENGRALRYGVGVGKQEAFNFRGAALVGRKAQWPRWTPTANMINREPDRYGRFAGGLPGGPENPLGPRALYLYRDGADTLYRLHGTIEPWTIGTMVSSGCVRLINQDIVDLYRRVPMGSRVVVLPA
ncbi:L,D-transpeptidase [Aquabacter sp. P-9]|uniref:L,D-transpeptidase n=1 Tax=Aquabacter sediminis TaxID=3029197 RepID=UPI00237D534E|nr:L,D-transpeptidase [Aquabacter sp. P-9]MDE1566748.1 L,D-transpeptidase [Aquabacter sp. P-9]